MGVMVGWGNSAITTRVKGRIDRSIGEVHLGSALLGSQPAHQCGDWKGDIVGETHGLWVRPVLLSGEMHQGGREPQAGLVLQEGLPVVLETVSQPGGVDEVIHRLWEKREGKTGVSHSNAIFDPWGWVGGPRATRLTTNPIHLKACSCTTSPSSGRFSFFFDPGQPALPPPLNRSL